MAWRFNDRIGQDPFLPAVPPPLPPGFPRELNADILDQYTDEDDLHVLLPS